MSLVPRPKWRSTHMKVTEPTGRARNDSENTAKEYRIATLGAAKGNTTCGNTSTEAMP